MVMEKNVMKSGQKGVSITVHHCPSQKRCMMDTLFGFNNTNLQAGVHHCPSLFSIPLLFYYIGRYYNRIGKKGNMMDMMANDGQMGSFWLLRAFERFLKIDDGQLISAFWCFKT